MGTRTKASNGLGSARFGGPLPVRDAAHLSSTTATNPRAPAYDLSVGVAERRFPLGVTACALALGGFLLARLTAWPPHEDEALALFVGRDSLGELWGTVTGDRGGAPVDFLVAWAAGEVW